VYRAQEMDGWRGYRGRNEFFVYRLSVAEGVEHLSSFRGKHYTSTANKAGEASTGRVDAIVTVVSTSVVAEAINSVTGAAARRFDVMASSNTVGGRILATPVDDDSTTTPPVLLLPPLLLLLPPPVLSPPLLLLLLLLFVVASELHPYAPAIQAIQLVAPIAG
jgi:hypothetical protein